MRKTAAAAQFLLCFPPPPSAFEGMAAGGKREKEGERPMGTPRPLNKKGGGAPTASTAHTHTNSVRLTGASVQPSERKEPTLIFNCATTLSPIALFLYLPRFFSVDWTRFFSFFPAFPRSAALACLPFHLLPPPAPIPGYPS